MPIAGYCHECGEWVYVTADRSCPKGHPAAMVNGWYDTDTGAALRPEPVKEPAAPAVSTTGTRTGFLTDLASVFAQSRAYTAAWGDDTDMTIASNPVDGMWGLGKRRSEYSAALKVAESERVVYFWEMLKQYSGGIQLGSSTSESYSSADAKPSGAKPEAAVGPGSASWEWGYGTTRKVVEEVAARHGFTVQVVLARRAAAW